MAKINSFYSYLQTTYLNQFYKKYIHVKQLNASEQIIKFRIVLHTPQIRPNDFLWNLEVDLSTPFEEESNLSWPKQYNQYFISQYANLLSEQATAEGYAQIEAAMQLIVPRIEADIAVEPPSAWEIGHG